MAAALPHRSNASTLRQINVSLVNRQRTRIVDMRLFRRIIKTLLSEILKTGHADLAIHLVATREMTRLNETFLRHAGPTDVITFDYADNARHKRSDSRLRAHGEIFICVDEAVAQARRFRTTWQSELGRYAIHGILHLLGFDDLKPVARRSMKRAESRCLGSLASRHSLTKLARRRATR